MSMIVHVRWVGGLVNVHVYKIFKNGYVGGNTNLEETMLHKTLLLFPNKNIDQNKLSRIMLPTKFCYKAKYSGKL